MVDFATEVERLRPQLMKYARSQLRNDAWAEDAVSETVLVALEKPQAFQGGSQLKTWLVGILKHKLIDQLRRHTREVQAMEGEDGTDMDDLLFDADGHWREMPTDWSEQPEQVFRQQQFIQVLDACVEQLPTNQGRAFMMREWLELDTDQICKEVGVSPTNLWVLLHRARLRLRECLQHHWFQSAASAA